MGLEGHAPGLPQMPAADPWFGVSFPLWIVGLDKVNLAATALVHARSPLPIDDVIQLPGILIQIPLQFALFVDGELSQRV
jgi:hypothetical protein